MARIMLLLDTYELQYYGESAPPTTASVRQSAKHGFLDPHVQFLSQPPSQTSRILSGEATGQLILPSAVYEVPTYVCICVRSTSYVRTYESRYGLYADTTPRLDPRSNSYTLCCGCTHTKTRRKGAGGIHVYFVCALSLDCCLLPTLLGTPAIGMDSLKGGVVEGRALGAHMYVHIYIYMCIGIRTLREACIVHYVRLMTNNGSRAAVSYISPPLGCSMSLVSCPVFLFLTNFAQQSLSLFSLSLFHTRIGMSLRPTRSRRAFGHLFCLPCQRATVRQSRGLAIFSASMVGAQLGARHEPARHYLRTVMLYEYSYVLRTSEDPIG